MTKTQAYAKAASEVVVIRYQGRWAVGVKPSKLFADLDRKTAYRYRRELVLERALTYIGYPISRVYALPPELYQSSDLDTLIDVLEVATHQHANCQVGSDGTE